MQLTDIQRLQSLSDEAFSFIKFELTRLNELGNGYGQIKLGKLCGVDPMTINAILHGKIGSLKVETLARMATRLIENKGAD